MKTSLQRFPMVAHNLKVTFNDLTDFNDKFKELKMRYNTKINITKTVGSNVRENDFETQDILTLNHGKIGEI
ncbi:hypothetical protein RhiirC2_755090, partial [Rhizophagus irregularis]